MLFSLFLPPPLPFLPFVPSLPLLPSQDGMVWALRFFAVHWFCFAGLHSSAPHKASEEESRGWRREVTAGMWQTALKRVCNLARWMGSLCAAGALESRFKVMHNRGRGGARRGGMSNFHIFPSSYCHFFLTCH